MIWETTTKYLVAALVVGTWLRLAWTVVADRRPRRRQCYTVTYHYRFTPPPYPSQDGPWRGILPRGLRLDRVTIDPPLSRWGRLCRAARRFLRLQPTQR